VIDDFEYGSQRKRKTILQIFTDPMRREIGSGTAWFKQLTSMWLALHVEVRVKLVGYLFLRLFGLVLDFIGIAAIGILISGSVEGHVQITIGQYQLVSIPDFNTEHTIQFSILAAVAFLLRSAYSVLITRAYFRYLGALATEASVLLFRRMLNEGPEFRAKYSVSELQFLLTSSTNVLFTQLLGGALVLVSDVVSATVFAVLLIAINVSFGIGALLFALTVVGIIYSLYALKNSQVGRKAKSAAQRTIQSIVDTSNAYSELVVFGKTSTFEARFRDPREQLSKSVVDSLIFRMSPRTVMEAAFALGLIGFVVANSILPTGMALGGAEIGAFGAAVMRLSSTLLPIQQSLALLSQAEKQVVPAVALLYGSRAPTSRNWNNPKRNSPGSGARNNSITLKSVSFTYEGSNVAAVTDINIEVPSGGYMAIVGPSGAGKSTLVELVLGLAVPNEGAVSLGGCTPIEFRNSRPGNLAYLPQKPGFISGSVAENIALGEPLEDIDFDRVLASLEPVGLIEVVKNSLGGVQGHLGAHLNRLSGGQLQRLGLARALYFQPSILVLDEATSNLDPKSEGLIEQALLGLEATTILSVAHKLHTIRNADSLTYLENGRVVASGPLEDMKKELTIFTEYSESTGIWTRA